MSFKVYRAGKHCTVFSFLIFRQYDCEVNSRNVFDWPG